MRQRWRIICAVIAALAVVAALVIFFLLVPLGLKLTPKVQDVRVAGSSSVQVTWTLTNGGGDPAFFRSCTITLGGATGSGVAGSWTGGDTGVVGVGERLTEHTAVIVSSGSPRSVRSSQTKVSCIDLKNAHSGI